MSKLILDPASHLLLHPTLNTALKVLATTTGRDKLQRTLQYYSRFLAYVYERRGLVEESKRWNGLKGVFGNARKVLRMFKFLEHLQSALRLSLSTSGDWAQITQIARQVGYAGFLFFDHLGWAGNVKLLRMSKESVERANKLSQRFWLAGILLSLVNSGERFAQIRAERKRLTAPTTAEKETPEAEKKLRLHTLTAEFSAVRMQFVQDTLDFWLPASNLGIVSVSEGFAGACGTITSVMGFYQAWKKASGK
ncbi:peroxisomal biogenesis factor 11 [Dacryopinax primogenitus]|uniref:Peroxisomal biogenesis factor 11 n=1 Tax=Dacryopinax primogenitus (strain DJM 731) TaxID=1858805 RepID=M5FRL1_DACPD|nr:peroxisomal biogenesis factor 11 [Dacryopinax primogenitus]EJT99800.1 peroxisomal biogenesis factor 11 [Dacryopinax primogenitus]